MSRDFEDWDNRTPHESPYELQRAWAFQAARRRKRMRTALLALGLAMVAAALALASVLLR